MADSAAKVVNMKRRLIIDSLPVFAAVIAGGHLPLNFFLNVLLIILECIQDSLGVFLAHLLLIGLW